VDSNLKEMKTKKASAADQASEKKFRSGLSKQIANIKKKSTILGKKTNKASLKELVQMNKSEAKFNAT